MSVGCSDYTPTKEQHYAKILSAHIALSRSVISKYQWTNRDYLLIDATAGSGIVNGIVGSPLVFLDQARLFENWRAVFIEEQKGTYKDLLRSIDQRYGMRDYRMTVIHGSHVDYISAMNPDSKQIGLLYVDPNGLLNFEAVRIFTQKITRMEILLSFSATAIKRVNGSPLLEDRYHLEDLLTLKTFAHIRKPYGNDQWSFLLMSNTPIVKEYKSIDLRSVASTEGAEYLRTMNYTKAELNELYQPALPELCGISKTSDLSDDQSEGD